VPLDGLRLLIPNVALAEVINHKPLDLIQGGPEWLLGVLRWREQELPVVSMERLLGFDLPPTTSGARVAVFNSSRPIGSLPFFAATTAGIPRLLSADEHTLGASLRGDRDLAGTAADRVKVGAEEAIIPDLEAVQTLIEEAWSICRGEGFPSYG
jgi:chemosensory pili system protein ChpC